VVAWFRVSSPCRGELFRLSAGWFPHNKGNLRATQSNLCRVFNLSTTVRIGLLRPQALWTCHKVIYKKA